jgi:hypothetical protein
MVRRVIIGQRGADTGMWITPAGKDAATAIANEDFLVNNSRLNTQPVFKGVIINPVVTYKSTTKYTYLAIGLNQFGAFVYNAPVNGVATFEATISHGLGYLPQCILSSTTEYPGSPCPNIFIDTNNIYLRYYEKDEYYTPQIGFNYEVPKPSALTMYCTVHYTLFAQAA